MIARLATLARFTPRPTRFAVRSCEATRGSLTFVVQIAALAMLCFGPLASRGRSQEANNQSDGIASISSKLSADGHFLKTTMDQGRERTIVMLFSPKLEALRLAASLPTITELHVAKMEIGQQASELLGKCRVTKSVTLWECPIENGDVGFLTKIDRLKTIDFRGCKFDGDSFRKLSIDSELDSIYCTDCELTNRGRLTLPAGLKKFSHLRLSNTHIDKDSFLAILKQPSIGHAQFVNSGIQDDWLKGVKIANKTILLVIHPGVSEEVRQKLDDQYPDAILRL